MRCRKRMPLFQGDFKQNVPSSWSSSSGPSVFSMWNCISEKKRIISAEMGRIPHRNSEPTRHLERPPNFLPNMASSHVTDKSYQATPAEWSYRLNHSTNVSRLYLFQIFCFSTKKSSVFKFSYSFCTGN